MFYGLTDETGAKTSLPPVVHVDGENRIVELGTDPAAADAPTAGQLRGDTST